MSKSLIVLFFLALISATYADYCPTGDTVMNPSKATWTISNEIIVCSVVPTYYTTTEQGIEYAEMLNKELANEECSSPNRLGLAFDVELITTRTSVSLAQSFQCYDK